MANALMTFPDVTHVDVFSIYRHRPRTGRPPFELEDAKAFLILYLSEHKNAPAGEVIKAAELLGISRRTLRRATQEIGVVRTPPVGRSVRWSLKK